MTTEIAESAPHRLCTCCQLAKLFEDFRRRHRDRPARLSQCRDCHNEAERLRRSFRRDRVGQRGRPGSLMRGRGHSTRTS